MYHVPYYVRIKWLRLKIQGVSNVSEVASTSAWFRLRPIPRMHPSPAGSEHYAELGANNTDAITLCGLIIWYVG